MKYKEYNNLSRYTYIFLSVQDDERQPISVDA